jgi:sRNA-binding carbon storage regulator CsrA
VVLLCRDIRHEGEKIFVGDRVDITVVATHDKKVRIGIEAPPDIAPAKAR